MQVSPSHISIREENYNSHRTIWPLSPVDGYLLIIPYLTYSSNRYRGHNLLEAVLRLRTVKYPRLAKLNYISYGLFVQLTYRGETTLKTIKKINNLIIPHR